MNARQGTPILPRDAMFRQMFGRLSMFTLPDGRRIYPMVARVEVSECLDTLSQTPGDILIRLEEGWGAIPFESIVPISAHVYRSSNIAGVIGQQNRLPYNAVVADPAGWWTGTPDFEWTVDRAGLYLAEMTARKTANNIASCSIRTAPGLIVLAVGNDIANQRGTQVTAMLSLEAGAKVTSSAFNNAAGTYEGGGSGIMYFKLSRLFATD